MARLLTEVRDIVTPASPKPRLLNVTRHVGDVPKAFVDLTTTQKSANDVASRKAKVQEDTHFRIMRILQENPDLTQRELAEKLGMSLGGLNFCLNALIDKGFVKLGNFQKSKNKFKYVYLLTPQGIAEKVALTSRFLKCKTEEYEALRVEIDALREEVEEDGGIGKIIR